MTISPATIDTISDNINPREILEDLRLLGITGQERYIKPHIKGNMIKVLLSALVEIDKLAGTGDNVTTTPRAEAVPQRQPAVQTLARTLP